MNTVPQTEGKGNRLQEVGFFGEDGFRMIFEPGTHIATDTGSTVVDVAIFGLTRDDLETIMATCRQEIMRRLEETREPYFDMSPEETHADVSVIGRA